MTAGGAPTVPDLPPDPTETGALPLDDGQASATWAGSGDAGPADGSLVMLDAPATGARPSLTRAAVVSNDHLGDRYWRMRLLAPDIARHTQPGQFVMLTVTPSGPSNWVLPRPMAVADRDEMQETIDVVYGAHGWGTRQMAAIGARDELTVVGPLGNGFRLEPTTRHLMVVGRGIGQCSLSLLAVAASQRGAAVSAVLSARHREANVLVPFFEAVPDSRVVTALDSDGSSDPQVLGPELRILLEETPAQQIATCGSRRLLRMCSALAEATGATLQVAVEAHMACGMGYCHGCSAWVQGVDQEGPLVCRDGPVFAWLPAGR